MNERLSALVMPLLLMLFLFNQEPGWLVMSPLALSLPPWDPSWNRSLPPGNPVERQER